MLTLSIQINPKSNVHDIAAVLRQHADQLDGAGVKSTHPVVGTATDDAPVKTGKKAKAPKEEPVEEEETQVDMGFESDDAPEEEEEPTLTKQDVIAAFQAAVKKNPTKGKALASKVLGKFKVSSVHQLDAKDYSKVVELISA